MSKEMKIKLGKCRWLFDGHDALLTWKKYLIHHELYQEPLKLLENIQQFTELLLVT